MRSIISVEIASVLFTKYFSPVRFWVADSNSSVLIVVEVFGLKKSTFKPCLFAVSFRVNTSATLPVEFRPL